MSLRSALQASTSGRQSLASIAPRIYQQRSIRRAVVVPQARKSDRAGPSEPSKGFSFGKENGSFRVSLNETTISVPEQTALLAGLTMLGLGAVIGPLVIGIAVTAVTIGFTVSVGAFAVSTMFLPIAMFMLFTFLTAGGVFGGFALLGLGIYMPKMLSLVIAGAGLAIGWTAVRMFVPKDAGKRAAEPVVAKSKERVETTKTIDIDPAEVEAQRVSQELRDFDQLLADKEYQKRVDQWKSGGR